MSRPYVMIGVPDHAGRRRALREIAALAPPRSGRDRYLRRRWRWCAARLMAYWADPIYARGKTFAK